MGNSLVNGHSHAALSAGYNLSLNTVSCLSSLTRHKAQKAPKNLEKPSEISCPLTVWNK